MPRNRDRKQARRNVERPSWMDLRPRKPDRWTLLLVQAAELRSHPSESLTKDRQC